MRSISRNAHKGPDTRWVGVLNLLLYWQFFAAIAMQLFLLWESAINTVNEKLVGHLIRWCAVSLGSQCPL